MMHRMAPIIFRLPKMCFNQTRNIVVPTAPHIVGVKRPPRPAFFDKDASLHYEIAVPEDAGFLLDWELEHAMHPKLRPSPLIGEITREEAKEMFAKSCDAASKSGATLLGFQGNELVIMAANQIITTPSEGYKQITQLPHNILKADYQDEIDKGPFKSVKLNMIIAFLSALDHDILEAFPFDSKVMKCGTPYVTHKDYRRKGHATEAGLLSAKFARDVLGCTHLCGRAVVEASVKIAMKEKNLKVFRSIKYPDFRAGGKPVFEDTNEAVAFLVAIKELTVV